MVAEVMGPAAAERMWMAVGPLQVVAGPKAPLGSPYRVEVQEVMVQVAKEEDYHNHMNPLLHLMAANIAVVD